jgi:hypothetical protein
MGKGSELQDTYEVVQERSLDKRNFRKRILTMGILTAAADVRRACLASRVQGK